MSRARSVALVLRDFVIGDDPLIAVIVALALGLAAILAHHGIAVWWLLPVAVAGVLAHSLHRATR